MPRNGKLVRITLALAVVAVAAIYAAGAGATTKKTSSIPSLNGAGSTFVAPLVARWARFTQSAINIKVSYNPVGSGGGVQAITDNQVDFGASDAPLSAFSPTCTSCVQIPWALAGTSVIYNVKGVKNHIRLTGPVIAKIYLGKITTWNNAAIKKLNPGVNFPGTTITPVYRSDSSGTSFNFTDFLSHVSKDWRTGPGRGTSVQWPTGVGEPKSAGVAGEVQSTPGAIGYVDLAYAKKNKIDYGAIQNKAGKFIVPTVAGFKAAAKSDPKPGKDGGLHIVDPAAKYKTAYPISTFTYIDLQKSSTQAAALKKFVTWAVRAGQRYAPGLFFAPLPSGIVTFDLNQLNRVH